MGYRQILNGIGFQSVNKRIDIPNVELGIDNGEDLKNQNLKVHYQTPKQFVVIPMPAGYEHWQMDGHSETLKTENLQSDFWMGDPKGVI